MLSPMPPITPTEALQRVIEHREIFHDEMLHIMRLIMAGEMSPVWLAAFIAALRVKKETIGEITAAAQVMREFSTQVQVPEGWDPARTSVGKLDRLAGGDVTVHVPIGHTSGLGHGTVVGNVEGGFWGSVINPHLRECCGAEKQNSGCN